MISSSFNEILGAQYKQSIWSIPISSVIGNSVVIPVLFLVIFLHWKQGSASSTTTAGYTQLLSGIMIMSYAVSAGHGLYQKIVAWQMALPSLQRLKDFLEVEMGTPSLNMESDREPLSAKREVIG